MFSTLFNLDKDSQELAEKRSICQDHLFELKKADTEVEQPLKEQLSTEEVNATEENETQPEELTNEIKKLERQLSEVGKSLLFQFPSFAPKFSLSYFSE